MNTYIHMIFKELKKDAIVLILVPQIVSNIRLIEQYILDNVIKIKL